LNPVRELIESREMDSSKNKSGVVIEKKAMQ